MGYERIDRRYGRDDGRQGFGGPDRYRSGGDRERGDYGRAPQGYDYDDRGFFDRAGDEVRSWFGDEDAERRRRYDERFDERGRHRGDETRDDYSRGGSSRFYPGSVGAAAGEFGSDYGDYGARARTGGEKYGGGRYARDATPGDYDRDNRARGARDRHPDPSYQSWRDRQMAAYDRDYDEFRRENQSRFDQEFATWRQTREGQRSHLGRVREHQEVVGSDGQHVGKVDKVRGDRIVLTKSDQDAGGHHHSIPCSWIESVDDKVKIRRTAAEAQAHWKDEERNGALFGRDEDSGVGVGPHVLNSSFSGTY